ncbi:MAG: RsmE family RNA methyltransferase [Candidatus Dependentiae bacterium]
MTKTRDAGHQFALFFADVSAVHHVVNGELMINDADMVRRISSILRLRPGDSLLLFDQQMHMEVVLLSLEKKKIICQIKNIKQNNIITPHITVWLPLLKREAFEHAIYSLVELGVNTIQLVSTAKEQRHWHGQKELNRLHNIMIAAAEQSKNFALPLLKEPRTLQELLLAKSGEKSLFFDVQGKPLLEVANACALQKNNAYIILVGPEGDLTESEKNQLRNDQFMFVHLTPTILRAQQAVAVGVGALRSLL